ncbi:MAG: CRISPR-associated endonuclease Cas1 [Acidobacteria bacterium]|nr:CRISPR-associated endonuclease Cas1 [Acidobacteriota bacterium]
MNSTAAIKKLKIRQVLFELEIQQDCRFPFFHGHMLLGFLSRCLGSHPPLGLIPIVCEGGGNPYRPGSRYRFGINLLSDFTDGFHRLVEGVERVSRERGGKPYQLRGNYKVLEIRDLGRVDLASQVERIAESKECDLHFITPCRLEAYQPDGKSGGGYLYPHSFQWPALLKRLSNRLNDIGIEVVLENLGGGASGVALDTENLIWLELAVEPVGKRPFTVGGVLGRLGLPALGAAVIEALVVGSYAHVGKGVNWGFGRFLVRPAGEQLDLGAFRPSSTLLARMLDDEVLKNSAEHVAKSSDACGVDGVTPMAFLTHKSDGVEILREELLSGQYRPKALRGFLDRKKNGKTRALAIPTARDRVAQRAACQVLGGAVESLFEDFSFGYRKGLSRHNARDAITDAYARGFRYTFDADISAFFDNVEWSRILAKLDALFPREPLIVEIRKWIMAPVVFEGRHIERERGLPQGAPISPVLANLFLDDLDDALASRGYECVRYADDFLVLCKDREEAMRARVSVAEELDRMGLELNSEKSGIRAFDSGFSYLGFLFCRSLVFEQRKSDASATQVENWSSSSWLNALPLTRLGRLRRTPDGDVVKDPEIKPLGLDSSDPSHKRALYITRDNVPVRVAGGRLIIGKEPDVEREPISEIEQLIVLGRPRVTSAALVALSQAGAATYFCGRDGRLEAVVEPEAPDWTVWLAQADLAASPERRLDLARTIVRGRLTNQATMVVKLQLSGAKKAAAAIRRLRTALPTKKTLPELSGLEGKASAVFLAAYRTSVPDTFGFEKRVRRPPTDPVNAMLSFAYTVLQRHADVALRVCGLNPRIGIFHQARGRRPALSLDLVEEFRHLAERTVLALIRNHRVTPQDFTVESDRRAGISMKLPFLRKFIDAVESALETTVTSGEEDLSYYEHIGRQARLLKEAIRSTETRYTPFRAKG